MTNTNPTFVKTFAEIVKAPEVDHREWLPTIDRAPAKPVAPKAARNVKGRTFGKRGA